MINTQISSTCLKYIILKEHFTPRHYAIFIKVIQNIIHDLYFIYIMYEMCLCDISSEYFVLNINHHRAIQVE